MQQILTMTIPLGAALAREKASALTGKRAMRVDRMAAFLRPIPKADGTLPTADQLRAAESCFTLRMFTDITKQNALTVQHVPVNALQSRELGPVPVQPFELADNQQFTVEWAENSANVFSAPAFAAAASLELVVVLWATDGRKA